MNLYLAINSIGDFLEKELSVRLYAIACFFTSSKKWLMMEWLRDV